MTLFIGGAHIYNYSQPTTANLFHNKAFPKCHHCDQFFLGAYGIFESWRLYFWRYVTSKFNPPLLFSRYKTSASAHERLWDLSKCTFISSTGYPVSIDIFHGFVWSGQVKNGSVSRRDQQRFLSNPYHLIIHLSLYHSTLYSLGTASLNNLKSICKHRTTKYVYATGIWSWWITHVWNCWFTQRCLLLKRKCVSII
jgi:hypothetical protein